jgi:ankyrin repeat protein
MGAVQEKAPDCCEVLIVAGAKLELADKCGLTALFIAIQLKHVDCCKVLLEAGANIHHIDKFGRTALMTAVYNNADDSTNHLDILRERMIKRNCFSLLLEKGAEFNEHDSGYLAKTFREERDDFFLYCEILAVAKVIKNKKGEFIDVAMIKEA